MFTVSAHRQDSGIGLALRGISAAALISAFAFLLLPKFLPARRDALPPITIDLFLRPEHKLATAPTNGLHATAKPHGLTTSGKADPPKLGAVGDAGGGAKTVGANGRS